MAVAKKITVDLETRTTGFTGGLDAASKDLGRWAQGLGDKVKGFDLAKVFGGSGASLGGIGKAAEAVKAVTGEVTDMVTKLRTGTGGWKEFRDALIEKIPIVGTIKGIADDIKELYTGAKAARIEAEKWKEVNYKVADSLRAIARERETFGKHGEARQMVDIDNAEQAERDKLTREKTELRFKLQDIQRQVGTDDATDGQRAEMARLQVQIRTIDAQLKAAEDRAANARAEVRRANSHDAGEFVFGVDQQVAAAQSAMRKKVYERQGKEAESAMEEVREQFRAKWTELQHSIDPFALDGMNEANKKRRIDAVKRAQSVLLQQANQTLGDIQQAQNNKVAVQQLAHVERMRQIQASANVETLKLEDDRINALNERTGKAERSHLAERAQVEEEARKARQDAIIKFRSEKPQAAADAYKNDPTVKATFEAIEAERRNKLAVLDQRGAIETQRNQLAALREQRGLWEGLGVPQVQYAARLTTINEQFDKFHDNALRAAQVSKLDLETYGELRRLNPDRQSPLTNLYGRTQSYAGTSITSGATAAQQQLELMKKQAAKHDKWDGYFRDIWEATRPKGATGKVELTI